MRKGNMKTLASVFIIASMMFSLGLGTMAYFNETVQAGGNTFTAGDLDIKLSSTGTGGWVSGPIAGYWDSPTNWAPGESYTRRLYFRNDGNVDVQVVLLDFKNYVSIEGPASFRHVIEVEIFKEFATGYNYVDYIATPPFSFGDQQVPLTLHELIATANTPGSVGDCDLILYMDPALDPHAYECDATAKNLMGNTYLAPNAVGWLEIGFKFSSTAGSEYENAECSFDLQMSFIQGPDSGVCRHELPGFIPNP